jgi:hypothetical protein
MKKAFGFVLAVALMLPISTMAAEETKGKIVSVDRAGESFTMADGTQLSLSAQQLSELAPGDNVLAAYEVQDGKKVVTTVTRDRAFDIESPGE